MRALFFLGLVGCVGVCWAAGCGGGDDAASTTSATSTSSSGVGGHGGAASTELVFDLGADVTQQDHFYDQPFPSDARLNAKGGPDLAGLPFNSLFTSFDQLRKVASEHKGIPVVPVAYFKFTGPVAAQDFEKVIPADKMSPVVLIDIDDASDEKGRIFPTIAATPETDAYVPDNLLAVGVRPGFVLKPNRKYAFAVMRSLGDASGKPLSIAPAMAALAAGKAPEGKNGDALLKLYAPLFATLKTAGIDPTWVAAANVFTTGDVVQDLSDLSTGLLAKYPVTVDNLAIDADDGASHPRYCELRGTVTLPQFQKGKPPYDTEGLFDFSDNGLPAKQRDEKVPVSITLPNGTMPAAGYPLVVYFHGSGGLSTAIEDRGTWHPEPDPNKCPDKHQDEWNGVKGCNTKGEGPAHVLAPHGFAMVNMALPVNPERLPGASDTAYLNLNNVAAGRDLFRQGVIEQRMLIKAMSTLQIDQASVAACSQLALPGGETKFKFDTTHLYGQGQSMGGQYVNLMGAVEPLMLGAVATGAGGYWSYFILYTSLIPDLGQKIGTIFLGTPAKLSHLHPGLFTFQIAWEPVDPMIYMPRVARRPLKGHPQRSIYEPVGKGDSYFPTQTYDAMALAYGHKEGGKVVWPTMQEALKLDGLDGLISYPIKDDLTSSTGQKYTGAILQYEGDGVYDPHAIYTQLDDVKYQYGCFLESMLKTGKATIPAPAALGSPCP
jgi:hypothetical protein